MKEEELAYRLWRLTSLRGAPPIDLSDPVWGEGVALGWVRRETSAFEKPDELWSLAARYVMDTELRPLAGDPTQLFSRAIDLWRSDDGESNLQGRALALLHDGGHVDIFSSAALVAPAWADIFSLLMVVENSVLFVTALDPASLIQLEIAYVDRVSGDGANGILQQKFGVRFSQHPSEARGVVATHLIAPDRRAAALFVEALAGLSKSDPGDAFELAMMHSRSPVATVADPAIFSLGRLEYTPDSTALRDAVSNLESLVAGPTGPSSENASQAIARLIERGFITPQRFLALAKQSAHGQYLAASWLCRNYKAVLSTSWLPELLDVLAQTESKYEGTRSRIDFLIHQMFKDESGRPLALTTLERWIAFRKDEIGQLDLGKLFVSTFSAIGQHPPTISYLMTRWLASEDEVLPVAARQLSSWLGIRKSPEVAFDLTQLTGQTTEDMVFLLRRTLGHIYQRDHLITLILSLADLPSAESVVFHQLADAFMWGPGYDYSERSLEVLRSKLATLPDEESKAKLFSSLVSAIEQYERDLQALPIRKELAPSYLKRRAVIRQGQLMNEKIHKGAEEASVLAQLATKIHLKAGRKTFGRHMGEVGELMTLSEFTHTIPWPRSESTEPVGRALQRQLYKLVTRVKQK